MITKKVPKPFNYKRKYAQNTVTIKYLHRFYGLNNQFPTSSSQTSFFIFILFFLKVISQYRKYLVFLLNSVK